MVRCVAYGCSNTSFPGCGWSFHSFPVDSDEFRLIRQKWIVFCRRVEKRNGRQAIWIPTKSAKLCSEHFTKDCFERDPSLLASYGYLKAKAKLKKYAVPTVRPTESLESTQLVLEPASWGSASAPLPSTSRAAQHNRESLAAKRAKLEVLNTLLPATEGATSENTCDTCNDLEAADNSVNQSADLSQPHVITSSKSVSCQTVLQSKCAATQVIPKTREIGCMMINPPVTTCEVGVQCLLLDDSVVDDMQDTDSASFHDTSAELDSDVDFDPSNMEDTEMDVEEEENATTFSSSSSPLYVLYSKKSPQNQQCYLVYEESLLELLQICHTCGLVCDVTVRNKGTMGTFTMKCPWGHKKTWKSQPEHCQLPWGNMLLAAAILFSGSSPSKAITLFKHLKLSVISLSTYCLIQRLYLIPTVIKTWHATQSQMLCDIQHRQVVIGGDARCDSPGHSAKYGSYTLMDLETNHVLDIQLVQSNEVQNSSWMELEGLKRGLAFLKERNITVKDLVTDRHVQVKSYMSRQEKEINHFFDVWHCAKGVSKKLEKAAKKRDGASIRPWIKSITNHMYWVAGSSSSDGDLKEQKWLSILNHVADIHEGHGDRFARCAHEELMEDREWMSQGSRQHKMVKEVVASRYLVKDIRKLSPSQQTYGLEVFHNIILHFAPKHTHYFYWPMTARLLLAALHFNENANRSQAKTKAGVERWAVNYPKAKKGLEAVVKPIKNKSTYDYIETLFDGVVQRRMTLTSYKMAKADVQSSLPKPPDHVTSQYNGTVCKATLVQQRKSRFANLSAV